MQSLFDLFYKCSGVSTDSRNIEKDNLYIALKGDNFDGNTFAPEAIKKGAKYAIVDNPDYADNVKIFSVNNGLKFLQELANHHRKKFNIPVIGITGSNGKTTTKELIASVLSQKFETLYTQGNLNNHIGVPLTLLRLNNTYDIAVIEMGANKLHDIEELTEIAQPTHGIITNIGYAHIEGFGSPEGVLRTKKEMYDSVSTVGGTLFYNEDDETLKKILPSNTELISYGTIDQAAVQGKLIELGPEVKLKWWKKNYESPVIETKIIGKYNFYNMLAAICIGDYFELQPGEINKGIETYEPRNNRSQIQRTERNTLILDAYNANPTSVRSALESFGMMNHENKFFVLGDMLELGEESQRFHEEIIALTVTLGLQGIFVGKIYKNISINNNAVRAFINTEEAKEFLKTAQPKNNLILLKGSRGIGLEKLSSVL
ncbi:MAG: UDP-N-acetylmuramoyl-tripeptide--D-alanyl-D-alanine ligase [Brumimicrobium sp.]|nr:UDP-N-acetylmuramoyl-tripeptide--D-alanyl-D-alanine ligase [Brumimicrobium sp.]